MAEYVETKASLSTIDRECQEFEKRLEELKVEETVKEEVAGRLEKFLSLPEQKIASGETDRILENLTREYHRSTGS